MDEALADLTKLHASIAVPLNKRTATGASIMIMGEFVVRVNRITADFGGEMSRFELEDIVVQLQVRKTPCRPRNWTNFNLSLPFIAVIPTGIDGPTCIFWANLTPFWLQTLLGALNPDGQRKDVAQSEQMPVRVRAANSRGSHTLGSSACQIEKTS